MDNDFDWACRRLARLNPSGLLSWLLTDFTQHLRFDNWLDTRTASLPGVPQGVRDTIAGLQELALLRAWAFFMEFQTEPDPDMFGRLLIYLGTTWLELRPDPLPGSRYHLGASVVNLTGTSKSLPASVDMKLPGPDGVGCILKAREHYLQEEEALPLLHAIQSGQQARILLPWIVLMKIDDLEEVIRVWLKVWAGETDERMKNEYVTLARVFMELSAHRERWRQALEGLDVKKSAFLEEVRKEGRLEGIQEGRRQALEGLDAKKSAFLEEGRLQGIQEGQLKERAANIVAWLRMRFPNQLPTDLACTIEGTREPGLLDRWFAAAAAAASIDDFRKLCGL